MVVVEIDMVKGVERVWWKGWWWWWWLRGGEPGGGVMYVLAEWMGWLTWEEM